MKRKTKRNIEFIELERWILWTRFEEYERRRMSVLKCEWWWWWWWWLWQAGLLKMRTMRLWKFLRWSFFGNQQFVCLEAIVLYFATTATLPAHKANNYVSECENMERSKHFGELKQPVLRQLITQKICKPSVFFFFAQAHFEWTLNTPFMSTALLIAMTRPSLLKQCSLATHFYREIDTFLCVSRTMWLSQVSSHSIFIRKYRLLSLLYPRFFFICSLSLFLSQSLSVTLSFTLSPYRFSLCPSSVCVFFMRSLSSFDT